MLKIKDNVDLKELKRFGFKIVQDDYEFKTMGEEELFDNYYGILAYKHLGSNFTIIIENDEYDREIKIIPNNNVPFKITLDYQLSLLYDLIKADLVEKVED